MSDWNPDLYRQFEEQRTRPASELLAQVHTPAPKFVVDLGCGPGNSTELLARRFGNARIVGTDWSEAMLVSARERLPACEFQRSDIASWRPEGAPDVVFANASLQWVRDHAALLPRLFDLVAPGGTLAVQMPDNWDEPTHRLMRETAALAPWADHLRDAEAQRAQLLGANAYYDLLAPQAERVDVWRTAYHHPMGNANDIIQWLRATGLKPYIEPLAEDLQASFLDAYRERIEQAYPPRSDGRLLMAFPRLFIVAKKK